MHAKLRFCLFIAFMMECATVFDTVAACDVGGILTCKQLIVTSAKLLSEGVLPDATTLKQDCSLLDNYTTCFDEKLMGCDSKIKLGISIVKDAVDFMCRDSYQAILDNSECWIHPVLKSDIYQCKVTYKETNQRVKEQINIVGATEMYRQLCEAMYDVTHCMSSAAKTRCGKEPELIMHNMMNAALRQSYTLVPGCSTPTLNIMVTTSTTIESRTTPATRGSRTTPTSDSSTTKYSYALYVTFIVSCIFVLAA